MNFITSKPYNYYSDKCTKIFVLGLVKESYCQLSGWLVFNYDLFRSLSNTLPILSLFMMFPGLGGRLEERSIKY